MLQITREETTGVTTLIIDTDFVKKLLMCNIVVLTDHVKICNPLSLEERIRIGNWFMTELATKLGQVDAPMTRKELIDRLKEFDTIDPDGSMIVTSDKNIEINDVVLIEMGNEKWLEIK